MQLSVHYTTAYAFSEPVQRVVQLLRVTPESFVGQEVLDWRVDLDCDAKLREGRDGYGNITQMLYLEGPVRGFEVAVSGRLLTEDKAGIVRGLPHELPPAVFSRDTELTQAGPAVEELAHWTRARRGPPLDRLHRLAGRLHETMRFDTAATAVDTPAEQACAAGHGVCQDFAHIFIAVARRLDLPARYVSGHLYRRDGRIVQEAGHAWAEAWIDDLGWTAFDPLNGISADDAYVRVACGLDYRGAAPVAGTRAGGGQEEMTVEVRVAEAGRKPGAGADAKG